MVGCAASFFLLINSNNQKNTPKVIISQAIDGCTEECLVPYLIYNSLIFNGYVAHAGIIHVKQGQASSYALNDDGRVMQPDVLFQGSKTVKEGFNGYTFGVYPIEEFKLDKSRRFNYSAVEFTGINCAGFVEEIMQNHGIEFLCGIPFLGIRLPWTCRCLDSPAGKTY